MLGFDWVTHKGDPAPGDSDMAFTGLLPPTVQNNRDRFDLVESLSGWNLNDKLRGDNRDALTMAGHELDAAGIARINGLASLLPPGATSFTGGNILIGGAGSDEIEGRGGDDIIDGDAWLNVRIIEVNAQGVEIRSAERMSQLNARVLAGTINPGNLRIVREIISGDAGTDVDVAVFSGPRNSYDLSILEDGTVVVAHEGGTGLDGTDRVRNVELLRFLDRDVAVASLGAPVAEVTPTTLAFGDQATGTTSAEQTVTVTNSGLVGLVITDVASDRATFVVTNNSCATVAPAGSCTFGVTFTPTAAGAEAASITVSHNAAGGSSGVAVDGTGVAAPVAEISPVDGFNFGDQAVGASSLEQTVTVSNTGNVDLVVSGVVPDTAAFVVSNNGCAIVAPAGSCTFGVTFSPVAGGIQAGQITVAHNGAGGSSVVTVVGNGVVAQQPILTMPASVNFGTRRVGTIRSQDVRITNQGPGPLLISSVSATGPFTVTLGNCLASLPVGRSCKLSVTFTPPGAGTSLGVLTVVSNAEGRPHTAALTGTGR